jgi:hypothetical protein
MAANSGTARLASIVESIVASIAWRAATVRQQSNIDFLNDINSGVLKDSALFNLNIAINSLHRTGDLRSFSKAGKAL